MAVDQIELINFRGFRRESIKLKPLTVLLGPNSAGKSAFGHALAAMAHAHRAYGSGPQASLTPPVEEVESKWPVDLGKTEDLRTHGAQGPVHVRLRTGAGWVDLGFGGLPDTPDLLISYISHPGSAQSASSPTSENSVSPADPKARSAADKPKPAPGAESGGSGIAIARRNVGQWHENNVDVSVILRGLVLQAVQHTSGTAYTLSNAAQRELAFFLETLTYLRANRKRPSRGYAVDVHAQQPIGYSGEWTPTLLLRQRDAPVEYLLPPPVPHSTDEAKALQYDWKRKRATLEQAVGQWLALLNLAERIETVGPSSADARVKMRITLEHQASRDITEIGFGISQVIPILVAGLQQPANSLFIVDLPEGHLHPRPQGAIADFFCALALSGRKVLVETHSEMFFQKLRLRAAMTPQLMQDIVVYFIDPAQDGVCSPPREVELGAGAELRWPPGFLQEVWETTTQLKAVRQAVKSTGG